MSDNRDQNQKRPGQGQDQKRPGQGQDQRQDQKNPNQGGFGGGSQKDKDWDKNK